MTSIYKILKRDYNIEDRDLAHRIFTRIEAEEKEEFTDWGELYEIIDEVIEEVRK